MEKEIKNQRSLQTHHENTINEGVVDLKQRL